MDKDVISARFLWFILSALVYAVVVTVRSC